MIIQVSIATQVSGIFRTIETNRRCWYICYLQYDTYLECYGGVWNLGNCFGVKCLVVENLVLRGSAALLVIACYFENTEKRNVINIYIIQVACS